MTPLRTRADTRYREAATRAAAPAALAAELAAERARTAAVERELAAAQREAAAATRALQIEADWVRALDEMRLRDMEAMQRLELELGN